MPSDSDAVGDGESGLWAVSPLLEGGGDGTGDIRCSVNAVVGAAFAAPGVPEDELPSGGIRPTEKREDVDIRDERDAGRRGDGAPNT